MVCSPCRWIKEKRGSREVVLVVVSVALFLDCMLYTVVVPIIPSFLYELEFKNGNTSLDLMASSSASKASMYSLYDNATILSDQSIYQGIDNKTQGPSQNSSCNMETRVLQQENVQGGLLLASKAMVQIIASSMVGVITNRFGYEITMFFGFIILFLSTLFFAFADSYWLMLFARSIQGVGSSLCTVAGLGITAQVYPDDYERGKAMGIALGGLGLGLLAGAPFGSFMYQFVGKSSPFLVLAALALLDGALQLCMLRFEKFVPGSIPSTSYLTLLKDPYIIVAAGSLSITSMSFGVVEPTLPIWMIQTMCSPTWQLGLVFIFSSTMYLLCTNLFGSLAYKMGRWLCAFLGMIVMGIGLFLLPLASNIYGLIGPMAALGLSFGMVDTSISPIMGQLVDLRHTSVYGGIYAVLNIALCVGFAVGPLCGGAIAEAIGFPWLLRITGLVNIIYCPLCLLLRNPPAKEEKMAIISQKCPMETYIAQRNTPDPAIYSDHSSDKDISTPNNRTMKIPH
ncbi:chromaffin granule amine transporter-like [Bufo gargarizans]|uniref:chromaffin granule amine transporter-like n=1 Tax=Bufo gargarizans TaxID=30331 RepID=UPI001CF45C83|nr:chromaffin granule amine transporter-like [Bufo gargarizans]